MPVPHSSNNQRRLFIIGIIGIIGLTLMNILTFTRELGFNDDRPFGSSPQIIITMTSVPERLDRELPIALQSLLFYQTYKNLRIYLAVAEGEQWESFQTAKEKYPILNDDRLSMKQVPDYGAAKKFIPAIEEFKDDPEIILMTVDDDFFYSTTLVEDLVNQFRLMNSDKQSRSACGVLGYRNKEDLTWGAGTLSDSFFKYPEFAWYYIRGFRIRSPYQVGIVTGGGGVMFRPFWFKNSTIADFSPAPSYARIVDDIWLNGHFSLQGIKRFVVPVRDFAYSVVKKSMVEHKLDQMSRWDANTNMMRYFKDTFRSEDLMYKPGGLNAPLYNSYFSIGVIEPIVERIKGFWIRWTFGS